LLNNSEGGSFVESWSFSSYEWKIELQYKNMVNSEKKHKSKTNYQWIYF